MITRKMVFDGYYKGLVRLIESPHEDGVACQIGDNWFYFGGLTAEECKTVEKFKMEVDTKTIIDEIYSVLNDFKDSSEELKNEYLYYEYYLKEKGIKEENNMDWKEKLYEKLDKELENFRNSYNSMEIIQIYNNYYIIGFYESIHELLLSDFVENNYEEVLKWLSVKEKPLEFLYEKWKFMDGSFSFSQEHQIDWISFLYYDENRKED